MAYVENQTIHSFNETLATVSNTAQRKFYRDDFIDMMRFGLDASLRDRTG
ncbi:MAG: hypothetical protein OES38_05595 [Gammaproteobacteria bacterium]|nr:hypothetical protein [Gammaproteobacteria bacterium]